MKTEKQTSKQRRKTSMPDFLLATRKIGDVELTERELHRVSGGIMQTRRDTAKNSISNVR